MTAAVNRNKKEREKRLYSQHPGLKLRVNLRGLGTVNKKAITIALLEEVVEVMWVMDDTQTSWFITV